MSGRVSGMAGISVALPEHAVPVQDLDEYAFLSEPERQVFDSLGIQTVIHSPETSSSDLAARAADRSLEVAGIAARNLDAFVSVQGRVPDKLMSSEATRIQAAIGADRAVTFSVSDLGCVSISAALLVGRSLLDANPAWNNILIAHGSKPVGPRRYRHPVTINGDGGIALVLQRRTRPAILDIALETNGEFWDLYRVEFKDRPVAEWVEECKDLRTYSFKLAIESRNRFRDMNDSLLSRNGMKLSDISHVVMQNLSTGAFNFYEEFFGIQIAKSCRTNLESYGHLGSMDVIFNLKEGIDSGEFSEDDLVLVMNNSPVAAWSSMLVRI